MAQYANVHRKHPVKHAMQHQVAVVVRRERIRRGWSQRELASRIHMSQSWIQCLETEKFLPPVHMLVELAAILEVGVSQLFGAD